MERELVDWLRRTLPPHPLLRIGLGDDAAVLSTNGKQQIVVTTDSLGDGAHFLLNEHDPRWIGHKCLAANLSDLAAMAARPTAVVISLMLPRDHADLFGLAKGLYEGMLPLAEDFDVALAGGDTNVWAGPLTVSITAMGTVTSKGPLLRSNAKPGDAILVTGKLGGSIAGRHLTFTPRIAEAIHLTTHYSLHAGMDITDGLALDLHRLCQASGVGADLERAAIPLSPAAVQLGKDDGTEPIEHALGDGEDFELLLTAPQETAEQIVRDQPIECGITCIGHITQDLELTLRDPHGATRELRPLGYLHH